MDKKTGKTVLVLGANSDVAKETIKLYIGNIVTKAIDINIFCILSVYLYIQWIIGIEAIIFLNVFTFF